MEFTVARFLALSEVDGIRLVAGEGGVNRSITRTNIMDNPDTFDWLMPGEFLLSTGYIFKEDPEVQRQIIRSLSEIPCSGLCIKVKRYLPEIPACMIEEADRVDLPLIELPFGYSLSTTSAIINRRLFHRSDELLEQTISIHREITRTALSSGGLRSIVETLSGLIGNPVLITDSSWGLLVYAEHPGNPFPLADHINLDRKSHPFPNSFLSTLPGDLRHYHKAVTRTFSLENAHDVTCRILPIAAHDYIYGYIVVWETIRKLTDLDYIALEQTSVVAAMERIRAKEVEQVKLRVRKDFFDDLLSGSIESRNAIRSLSELHGIEFDRRYRCLLVHYGQDGQQLNSSQAQFRQKLDRCTSAISRAADEYGLRAFSLPRGLQTAVLVELGTDLEQEDLQLRSMAQQIVDSLCAPPALDDVLVAVGKAVDDLSEVHHSFHSAQHGIRMAHTMGLVNSAIFTDDFAVYQLLSQHVDRDVLSQFCEGILGPLVRYDQENETQFVETLDKYFQHNGNISYAAKDMYIHRNTYIYRIEKIKSLLHLDLKNPQKLLELQLALLAYRLLL